MDDTSFSSLSASFEKRIKSVREACEKHRGQPGQEKVLKVVQDHLCKLIEEYQISKKHHVDISLRDPKL